jgi:perosamine synthetase
VEGVSGVWEAPDCKHVYHLYTLCVDPAIYNRDDFMRILYREGGVQGILHYQPTYHFTALKKLGISGHCPIAEEFFYKREINLPMHPRLTRRNLDDMILGICSTVEKLRERKSRRVSGTAKKFILSR